MSVSRSGRTEFFTREAGQYLRELEPLIGAGTPPLDALVRVARGLRGAAMLAGPATFARAAGELEALIRQLRDGSLRWTEVAPHLHRAVGEFRNLVGAVSAWDRGEDVHAAALADALRQAGGTPGQTRAGRPGEGSMAAARDYLASELERAARALGTAATQAGGGAVPEASVHGVRHSLLALRGIAATGDHPPLPQVLDAVAAAMAELLGHRLPRHRYPALLGTTGTALNRMAVAVRTGPGDGAELAAPELKAFAGLLHALFLAPGAVVDVAALLAGDHGATAPVSTTGRGGAASALDLAALGASLRHAASELRAAGTPLPWGLVCFSQAMAFRSARGIAAHPAVARLLGFAAEWMESAAARGPDARLVDLLERAGRAVAEGRPGGNLTAQLEALVAGRESSTVPELSITALMPDDEVPIVPIASLLAAPSSRAEPRVVPIETLAPDRFTATAIALEPADRTTLERGLTRYSRMVRDAAQSLTVAALAGSGPPAAAGAIPIQQLLYQGRRALERAWQVRDELERAFRNPPADRTRLEPLMRELLDLVPLALAGDV